MRVQAERCVRVGEEHHAIVVRLRAQIEEREIKPIEAFRADYDAVVVFANSEPCRLLKRLAFNCHWSNVVIREIPRPGSR